MQFHVSSTWSFSSGHLASKGHSALWKSLVVWPGFPALAVPSQFLDMPGILMTHQWKKRVGQAESCATSGGTQVLCHYLYSNSLKHGLRPTVVAKFKLLLQLNIFYCLHEEGAGGRVGQCLLLLHCFSCGGGCLFLEWGWSSRCNWCSPALCVLPEDSPAAQSALPVAGNPVKEHLCQSCLGDEASSLSKAQYFPFETDSLPAKHTLWTF